MKQKYQDWITEMTRNKYFNYFSYGPSFPIIIQTELAAILTYDVIFRNAEWWLALLGWVYVLIIIIRYSGAWDYFWSVVASRRYDEAKKEMHSR